MKINALSFFTLLLLWIPALVTGSKVNNMEKHHALNPRQQCINPIAALTAKGDINRLKPALIQGLDAGLTVNEIKE